MNSTDLIFSKQLPKPNDDATSKPIDVQETLSFCKECASRFLAPSIIEHFDIITQRIGIVYSYLVDEKTSTEIAKNFFKGPIDQQFEFRFSSRDIAPITQTRKDKFDYINKIYSSTRVAETSYIIAYDYQYFYEPAQSIISDKISKVIESSEIALSKDIFTKERD